MLLKKATIIASILLLAFLTSCSDSTSSSEEFGTVSGTVTFTGTWPATGEIQVSIWSAWPPAGPPAQASEVFTVGENEQTYKIEGLTKGEYPVVTLGWRDPADPANAKTIALYSDPVTFAPISIEISDKQMTWKNIDFQADLSVLSD
jgi:hypothetical protein